ncbi:FecR domain-containing protein [Stakelama sp. CBK3Z-3]|uniref:FecR domain-containing protein n=1 Tax=Stakelama flava TaxID=2860338 RepID=A0ABS6XQW4_9SPHN|nr:FecR domain-containing protein [Stakelama flava]MBW4331800.1 FecR domain-containing protein [Stakelama flava]
MNQAGKTEQIAAHWLMRREEPGWSAGQQAELEEWLAESTAHKAAFWRLEHGWRAVDRIASLGAPPTPYIHRPFVRSMIAMAATVLIIVATATLFVVSGPMQPVAAPRPILAETAIGSTKTVALADGSHIELNTNSRVRAVIDDTHREVWLDRGEAYFDVRHDVSRPFRIHAGDDRITVLGTRFNVRRDTDRLTVAVESGAVRLRGAEKDMMHPPAVVPAGVIAVVRGDALLLSARSPDRVADGLAWRQGMLRFQQEPLSDVVAEFNRYNQRPMVVTDPELARMRIGGAFRARNADAFLSLLEDVYHLRITRSGSDVKISQ